METGNGFNLERGRSPSEWHFKQGYHQMDHSGNMMHSRMYMEKMEPSSGEMKRMSPCACHGCNMSRQRKVFDEPMWMQQEQWCYQAKEFVAKHPSCAEGSPGMQSPCFSVRTPVRGGERSLFCPSVRMCMGGAAPGSGLGGASMRPKFVTSESQMSLHKWFLIPVKESENPSLVAVGGFVRYGYDTEFRKTSPIIDRNNKGRLKTSDGTEVHLLGCIDEEATTANGFTSTLTQFFYTGFPVTWKKLLEEEGTKQIGDERVTSPHRVEKPSSPGCVGTRGSTEHFTTPQATADSTLHGDDAPLREFFEQPVCGEACRPSTAGDQDVGEAEIAERCREVSIDKGHLRNGKEHQGDEVPIGSAQVGSRRRSAKRLPTRSSKRLKKARDKDRGQESKMATSDARTNEGEQNTSERCCKGEMNPAVPVDQNENGAHARTVSNREHKVSSARKKQNSEQESDGSNELRDRVSVDKADGDCAQVDVVSAPEIFSAVSAEPIPQSPLAQDDVEAVAVSQDDVKAVAVSQDDVEAVAELSVLEAEVDVPRTVAQTNRKQSTSTLAGRKRSRGRGRGGPKAGKKRKAAGKKTVEVVQETEKEQLKVEVEVEVGGDFARESDPPEAPAVDNRKPISKRKTRKRGARIEEKQMPSVPVVHVLDSDDEEQPANDDDKQVVESKELEDSVVEDKLKSRKAFGRTKRSSLPPPLPASRVEKRVEKSDVIEAFGLKTSRSGRLLVPPLAYWRNQTAARDRDGGIIAIMDGFQEPPSDTGYYNFKPPTEKRRLQEKLCATATDSPMRANDKGKKKIRGSK